MRFSTIALLYGANLAAAVTTSACKADNCLRAIRASAFPTRKGTADCSSYFRTTVTPKAVTVTPTVTVTVTLPASATAAFSKRDVVLPDIERRATGSLPSIPRVSPALHKLAVRQVTVAPSSIPTYASACSGSVRYSSACSCIGVTATTTTVPAPTITAKPSTSTVTDCANPLPTFVVQAKLAGDPEDGYYLVPTNPDTENSLLDFTAATKAGATLFSLDAGGHLLADMVEANTNPGEEFSIVFLNSPGVIAANSFVPLVCSVGTGDLSCVGQNGENLLQTCGQSQLYIANTADCGAVPELKAIPVCQVP